MTDSEEGKIKLGKTVNEVPQSLRDRIKQARKTAMQDLDNQKFQGEATQKWLKNMNQCLSNAEETIVISRKDSVSELTMIEMFDHLFRLFDKYAFEYNQNPPVAGMTLTMVKPTGIKEKVDYSRMNQKTHYVHGHLTGQHFTMVLYGQDNNIGIYIIPSDFMLGFEPGQFKEYVSLVGNPENEKTTWKVQEKEISTCDLPEFARRLISRLVTVAIGQSDPETEFKWSATEQEAKPAPVVADRSFEAASAFELMKEED